MTQDFPALPQDTDSDGNPRLTGVEIEFSGLEAADVARLAVETLGGSSEHVDDHAWKVTDTKIGKLDIYLDTALRYAESSPLKRLGLDLGKEVIPVEIVSEPLDLHGNRRLRAVHLLGRPGDVASFRHGDEGSQKVAVQARGHPLYHKIS